VSNVSSKAFGDNFAVMQKAKGLERNYKSPRLVKILVERVGFWGYLRSFVHFYNKKNRHIRPQIMDYAERFFIRWK
jgi:hypothetical protein